MSLEDFTKGVALALREGGDFEVSDARKHISMHGGDRTVFGNGYFVGLMIQGACNELR